MKFIIPLSVVLGVAAAHPKMSKTLAEIRSAIHPRAGEGDISAFSTELIGDLITLPRKSLTSSGLQIRNILTGFCTNPESDEAYTTPVPDAASNYELCAKDTCCVWKAIADDLSAIFRAPNGTCTELARKAVRLGFHDAGDWSKQSPLVGGADGSIILAPEELTRQPSRGLSPIADQYKLVFDKYHNQLGYPITYADLVQFGANTATVVCPLGPRVRSWVGRKDNPVANPDSLPSPFSDAATLIALFQDKTIEPHGLIALLGAHSTSRQAFVDPARAGAPQDSTPGVWDVKYYGETSGLTPAPAEVLSFPSDLSLAQSPITAGDFKFFANPAVGQLAWNQDYAREYIRLSLLGVQNINSLVECTKALPAKSL